MHCNRNNPGRPAWRSSVACSTCANSKTRQVYSEQLQYLEKLLARANSMVLTNIAPVEGEVNELTEGLKDVEADADWKKKVIYD